ncbi:MAG: RDD family protein [Streptosporangiaceae bacterium]
MTARTPAQSMVTAQGNYAGSVSRFLAYAIDLAVSTGLFTLGLAGVSFAVRVVTGQSVSWSRSDVVVAVIFALWQFLYFGYSWAASGRSFGMAVLGVQVVQADGTALRPRQGVIRALVFPLSFLLFGLGFLGILVQHEHRALHDLIAGTAVIYSWDARAARLRFLAREAELAPAAAPRDALSPAAGDGPQTGRPDN